MSELFGWGRSGSNVVLLGCSKGVSKSLQVLLNGIESVMILTLMILKFQSITILTLMTLK